MASSSNWLIALVALVALSPRARGQQEGFQALLWRYRGPALSKAYVRTLARTGVTGVCVDQDEDPKLVAHLGLPFYIDHAAGKGILHLREADWKKCFSAYEKSRSPDDLVRPYPLLAGATRTRLLDLVETRVKRALPYHPLLISLDDEISITRFQNPLDFCFDKTSLVAFRKWLRARYGRIDELNRVWGSKFESFAAVVPPTTDQVRQRELAGTDMPLRLSDWNDHRAFMDQTLARTVGRLCDRARELAPGVPVGFEGGQAPSAFGGYDYSLLLQQVDYIEPYPIGGTRELVRSLCRPGTRRYETLFPASDARVPEMPVMKLYDALAHGLAGVVLWSADDFFASGAPDRLSSYGNRLAAELPRATGKPGRALAGATVFGGSVAILESQASVRLHWMLDSVADGKTWIRRFSSYERTHSTSQAARSSWIRLLQDIGYAFHFVTAAELGEGRLDRNTRVLILPSVLAMSDPQVAAVKAFASRGGLVIADETPARYDRYLRLRREPALDEWFGVERDHGRRLIREGKAFPDAPRTASGTALCETGVAADGVSTAEQVGRDSVQIERSVDKGRAVLLNLAIVDYVRDRVDEKRAASCRERRSRVWRLLEAQGVLPVAIARVRGYPSVIERVLLRRGKQRVLVVRANCLESASLTRTLLDKGPQPMRLSLPVAATVRDFWTGKVIGRGRSIETKLDPLRGTFLIVEPL